MEDRSLYFAGIVTVVVIVLAAFFGWLDRKKPAGKASARRGAGNAMLGLQQFIEPSVEYVFQARNVEQKQEEDDQGAGADEAAVRSDLAESLGRSPVDLEEVRRHLAAAVRVGLDWRALFEDAVAGELRERPFRAPSMPPAKRVAPRGVTEWPALLPPGPTTALAPPACPATPRIHFARQSQGP